MKRKFSTSWKSSKQVRKQRKYRANAPKHIKRKMMAANLSKELRKKHGRRSFAVRKGDEVKVMRGKFKGKIGKISAINSVKGKIAVEGLQRKKNDGTKINILFDCSNVQIQKLDLNDRKRVKAISRGKEESKPVEKKNGVHNKKDSK